MSRTFFAVVLAAPLIFAAPANPQLLPRNRPLPGPKPEPVAETRLLMEGLLEANFRGLRKNLRQPPTDQETWTFLRGQALLIAETGNLLMLRPPRSDGQEEWLTSAATLREKATILAKAAAARDTDRARRSLALLAGTCNRCHQTFRVKVQVNPLAAGQ